MNDLRYFDCNARYGPRPKKHAAERWTKDHLLEDMDLAGVAGALVLHEQALLYDAMHANLRLTEETREDRDRLFPCWVAFPPCCGEFPDSPDLLRAMRDHDVRAVRIAPALFHIPLAEDIWAPLRNLLADERILIQISAPEFAKSFQSLSDFLTLFAPCNVLMVDAYWSEWRDVLYLMERHRNLHIEFSSFQAMRAVEHFAGRFGAERCLFGTNLPYKSPGAARAAVDWTFLPREDAAGIAGGNLARLLDRPLPEAPRPGPWSDTITDAVRSGRPLPCLTLDAHCHLLHDGSHTAGVNFVQRHGDAEGMAEVAARIGVRRTAVMSWTATICMDAPLGNRIVADAVRRFPDRYTGVVSVNPETQSADEIQDTIRTYHEELGFPGLEPFPNKQLIGFDDAAYAPWFEYADRNGLYVLMDWDWFAPRLGAEAVIAKYRGATFLAAHAGRSFTHADHAIALMRRHAHVFAEVDFTSAPNGLIEYFAGHVGADRLLFGTDAPMRDPRQQAGWVVFTRLSESDKRKILGLNFNGILRRAWGGRRSLHFEVESPSAAPRS